MYKFIFIAEFMEGSHLIMHASQIQADQKEYSTTQAVCYNIFYCDVIIQVMNTQFVKMLIARVEYCINIIFFCMGFFMKKFLSVHSCGTATIVSFLIQP